MPYFHSDGAALYYETTGEGPPIIFICPPGMGAGTFYDHQKKLKNHFQVITFDNRGSGKSTDGTREDYTISDWTEDIRALADHLKLYKVIVCGYSMGGVAAQDFALSYPERTAGVILLTSFSEVSTPVLSLGIRIVEFLGTFHIIKLLAVVLSLSHTIGIGAKKHRKKIFKSINSSNPKIVKSLFRSGRYYNATDRLPEITCPVAVVHGTLDIFFFKYQRLFEKKLPNVRSIRVEGIDHQVAVRTSDEVNGIIKSLKNWMVPSSQE